MEKHVIFLSAIVMSLSLSTASAVTTEFLEDDQPKDFKAGKLENVVISNLGRISLALETKTLLKDRKDVSAVFAIGRLPDGSIVAGTGPQGLVLKYSKGKWSQLFKADQPYVFSLVVGKAGKIYIGTAGSEGKIFELTGEGKSKLIFRQPKVRYIWALTLLKGGRLLAATGPNGQVFQIDKAGSKAVFTCKQKNVVAMAQGPAGRIYLGTDSGAVLYLLDPEAKEYKSRALFDAGEDMINAIAVNSDGVVYFGTASGKAAPGQARAFLQKPAGVPGGPSRSGAVRPTTTAAIDTPMVAQKRPPRSMVGKMPRAAKTPQGNAIYQLDQIGFVTEIFRDKLDFCWLACQDDRLYAGTWPEGYFLELLPDREEIRTAAKADAKFIYSALITDKNEILLATGSPGGITQLGPSLAKSGTFTSRVLDAKQVARWGKISAEYIDIDDKSVYAEIQTRTGAVQDEKDPAWGKWSPLKKLNAPEMITSPPARFIQYKITFHSDGKSSDTIKKVKIAYMQDNQPPQVTSLQVQTPNKNPRPPRGPAGPAKGKMFKLTWKAEDSNADKLTYDIYLRLVGTDHWIELETNYKKSTYQWDPTSVPDGEYQFKVVARDEPSNPVDLALTGVRLSDPLTVDNTAPAVDLKVKKLAGKKLLLKAKLIDELSEIASAWVRLNGEKDWRYLAPGDEIYDSTCEYVETVLESSSPGAILVAVKARDQAGNVGYGKVIVPPTSPEKQAGKRPATRPEPRSSK